MTNVRFTCDGVFIDVLEKPKASFKYIPEYYKKMPNNINEIKDSGNGTVKKCIPFLDAMSIGYIIPLDNDLRVVVEKGDISIYSSHQDIYPVKTHVQEQFTNTPISGPYFGKVIFKLLNKWVIETDRNYSCLFTSPLNHLETRFKMLDGIVDTDTYYQEVNFPFVWTGGEGEFLLKKGTPIIQVIPFKRENYKSSFGNHDYKKKEISFLKMRALFNDGYKKLFWHRRKEIE